MTKDGKKMTTIKEDGRRVWMQYDRGIGEIKEKGKVIRKEVW